MNSNIFQTVVPLKKKKLGKNPDVDTSFLPDRDREVRYYVNKELVVADGAKTTACPRSHNPFSGPEVQMCEENMYHSSCFLPPLENNTLCRMYIHVV